MEANETNMQTSDSFFEGVMAAKEFTKRWLPGAVARNTKDGVLDTDALVAEYDKSITEQETVIDGGVPA